MADHSEVGRELNSVEAADLYWVLNHSDFLGREDLISQIPFTRATGGLPSYVDLGVDRGRAPRSQAADGPIPVRVYVVDPKSKAYNGEILIWVKSGYLSSVEYAWVTDDAPKNLPPPEFLTLQA